VTNPENRRVALQCAVQMNSSLLELMVTIKSLPELKVLWELAEQQGSVTELADKYLAWLERPDADSPA